MKLQLTQSNLEKAVNLVSRFSSAKAQLPILGNILFTANASKLVLSATNLETSALVEVGAKVEEEGSLCIPSKTINEIVTNLPKETIDLVSEKEQLRISLSGFSSNVLGINSSDFPKVPNIKDYKDAVSLVGSGLAKSLSKVSFAVSMDETRPVLTGVLFIFSGDSLSLVGTDGFRLSLRKLKLPSKSETSKFVVPKLILSEISRTENESDSILFKYLEKEKQVIFGFSDTTLSSRLLEGEYPDFEKIIPKKTSVKISLDKEEVLRAVKLTSIFARESANVVKLEVGEDFVKFSAESSQSGNQEVKIDAKVETEEKLPFSISFNYKFLEDFLRSVDGENITMEFLGNNSAGVFKDDSDADFLHLIMPVRTQN